MSPPTADEAQFLRDLVKSSRQRTVHVKWVDRDGTDRLTVLSTSEATRLEAIARARKVSKAEVLRQAAHVPVQPTPPGMSPNK
jgi:predicted oxidoreductase